MDEVPVDGLLLVEPVLPLTGFWVLDEPVFLLSELDVGLLVFPVDAAGLLSELLLELVLGFELVVPVGFELLVLGLFEVGLFGDAVL